MNMQMADLKKAYADLEKHLEDRDAAYAQHKLCKQILQITGENYMKNLIMEKDWPKSEDGTFRTDKYLPSQDLSVP